MEITADHIVQYLDSRDDFDLELFAYRSLNEGGWESHLGGTYVDPYTLKPRQYDVRGRKQFSHRRDLNIAVECKSLSPDFPPIVSRIPRPDADAGHDILKRWKRIEVGDTMFSVENADPNHLHLYPKGEMVGKGGRRETAYSRGEQHCGERPNRDVRAGPLAEQDCEATRGPRTESGRRGELNRQVIRLIV